MEISLRKPLSNRVEHVGDNFPAWLGAEVTLSMDAHAHGIRFEVAVSDHEHGVDFHVLGTGDFRFDVIVARVELGADFVGAQFGLDGARVFDTYWP